MNKALHVDTFFLKLFLAGMYSSSGNETEAADSDSGGIQDPERLMRVSYADLFSIFDEGLQSF